MKIALVTLTRGGSMLGLQLWKRLGEAGKEEGWVVELFVPQHFAGELEEEEGVKFFASSSLSSLTACLFREFQGLIMIMAAGIAVRMIAPLLKDKKSDPAVVVMDEKGRFAISLVGGHLAGANWLAQKAAFFSGGQAVITTATDVQGTVAIEVLAQQWGMACVPESNWKKINAAFANGEKVGFYVDKSLPVGIEAFLHRLKGQMGNVVVLPLEAGKAGIEGYEILEDSRKGKGMAAAVVVTDRLLEVPFLEDVPWVFLRPRCLVAGVGCKRGVAAGEIIVAVEQALTAGGLAKEGLCTLASIIGKEGEMGLLEAAERLGVKAVFFSPDELSNSGGFRESEQVKKAVGVGAVCEPAAWLAAGKPERLLVPKTICGKVTVAIARANCG